MALSLFCSQSSRLSLASLAMLGLGRSGHKVICEISRLYLANNSGTDVSVVDTAIYALIGTVLLGGSPFLLGICSNGNALPGLVERSRSASAVLSRALRASDSTAVGAVTNSRSGRP